MQVRQVGRHIVSKGQPLNGTEPSVDQFLFLHV